jgi:glycosyltransferase involved in cell wall biosynthesis
MYVYDAKKRKTKREKLGVQPDELLVGHVGRFSPQKNHSFLINVFEAVQVKIPAKLLLVGDDHGKLADEIKEKVKSLGLEDRVIFAGLRDDVADLMQAMDVFVFPSLYEGLGIVAIEAQAAGLPCLISDHVPIECQKTELVEQVPLDCDVEIWADRAIAASKIERRNTYDEIKNAGFDVEENVRWLEKYYQQLLRRYTIGRIS